MLLLFLFFITCTTISTIYSQEHDNKENNLPIKFTIQKKEFHITKENFERLEKCFPKKHPTHSQPIDMAPTIIENILTEKYQLQEKEYKEKMNRIILHEMLYHLTPYEQLN